MPMRSADDFKAVLVLVGWHMSLNPMSDKPVPRIEKDAPPQAIEVEVMQGCVTEITGIPPGMVVAVVDHGSDDGTTQRSYFGG